VSEVDELRPLKQPVFELQYVYTEDDEFQIRVNAQGDLINFNGPYIRIRFDRKVELQENEEYGVFLVATGTTYAGRGWPYDVAVVPSRSVVIGAVRKDYELNRLRTFPREAVELLYSGDVAFRTIQGIDTTLGIESLDSLAVDLCANRGYFFKHLHNVSPRDYDRERENIEVCDLTYLRKQVDLSVPEETLLQARRWLLSCRNKQIEELMYSTYNHPTLGDITILTPNTTWVGGPTFVRDVLQHLLKTKVGYDTNVGLTLGVVSRLADQRTTKKRREFTTEGLTFVETLPNYFVLKEN
jgi:hypothetical protein